MNNQKKFRLVGVGASAGGLEAINDFFDNIPDKTGLAFVVIQHLSPDFKSMMSELLTRHTNMPITVITEDTPVEANHIYLISQRNNIMVEDGIIKQVDRQPVPTLNLPIDLFFHALGKDFRERSIGVVLSGTGTDGSRGIRTIKEAGGLVFVQDPKTAQFDGMPKASISMNIADNILPSDEIARKIVRITQKTYTNKGPLINIDLPNDHGTFQKILVRIEKFTKVDFREYRSSTLVRRTEKRMYLNHIIDLTNYYHFLLENEEEVFTLYKEFLIGVTQFFRDAEAFQLLKKHVIPELFSMKTEQEQIRIWCMGCSTGEEAYSIACLMMEHIEENNLSHSFKIFATDLDDEAIRFGSIGVYHDNIAADIPNKFLEKYFTRKGGYYAVNSRLRENIVFTVHDALRDPPFINIDLVTCRNMMIYLNPSIQKDLLINFQFALNFLGYMFLGPSESITSVKNAFDPVSSKWNIFKKIVREKPVPFSKERSTSLLKRGSTRSNKVNIVSDEFPAKVNENAFAKAMADKHAPRSLFVDKDFRIIYINGRFDEILKFPQAFADLNLLNLIEEDTLLFKTGVRKALQAPESSLYKNVELRSKGKVFELDVRFQQFKPHYNQAPLVWIEFYIKSENKLLEDEPERSIGFDDYQNDRFETLEDELRLVNKEKQILVEQVETANEELQSSNEELLASNEELQSTNEELQSVNEELYTVNVELQTKVNELLISNNDINNLLESTEIGTVFLDKKLRIRKYTPALKEQFNLEESDIGRSITTFTNSFKGENIYKEVEKVLAEGKFVEREISDQNDNIYLMRILAYRKDEGELDGVIITFVNINELKNAQRELRQSAESYQAIAKNSGDIISITDINGIIQEINVDNVGGFKKVDLIGMKNSTFVKGEYSVIFDKAQAKLRKTKKSQHIEIAIVDPDGKKIWLSIVLTPIIVEDEIKHIISVSRNITKHKEMEYDLKELSYNLEVEAVKRNKELNDANKELKEINSYLDSFVHGAAHDLRSPIMQMKGMLNLFPKIKSIEKKEEIIGQFSSGVYHLESTINGLIEMIEFQKNTELLITSIDLVQVFEDVKEQLSHELKNVDATLETSFVEDVEIRYIKAYITSIFYNLLSNAIKYRSFDKPLEIKVSITKEDIYTIISVADNGIGIDLARYGHFLFKPFKRLTLERQGTGIGLSIINNVAKKNGGRIDVKSKINKGTTFSIYLVEYSQKISVKK